MIKLLPGRGAFFGGQVGQGRSSKSVQYSPRLRSLNFYEAHWGGRLEWLRSDPTSVPELTIT